MNFYVKIRPSAKVDKIVDLSTDIFGNFVLKLQIKAIPEKGKANDYLIRFLSDIFKMQRKDITILQGKTSSLKLIEIPLLDSQIFENIVVKHLTLQFKN